MSGIMPVLSTQAHKYAKSYIILLRDARLYPLCDRALMDMQDAGTCLEQCCPTQVERTRITVFSSTAGHFERLSSGLIPGLNLRLVWVSTLLQVPLQHILCLCARLRSSCKPLNRLFIGIALDDDADGSIFITGQKGRDVPVAPPGQ